MTELIENITECLEKLLHDLARVQATLQSAADREYFARTMWRLGEACRETKALAEILRMAKAESWPEPASRSLEWTARLAALDTVNNDTRN